MLHILPPNLEEIVKWKQMTALRFPTRGSTSDSPGLPSGETPNEDDGWLENVGYLVTGFRHPANKTGSSQKDQKPTSKSLLV